MLEQVLSEGLAAGGPVAIILVIVLRMWRSDRKGSELRSREDRKFMEDRLTHLLERGHECTEKHTAALTELTTLLKSMNGRLGRGGG